MTTNTKRGPAARTPPAKLKKLGPLTKLAKELALSRYAIYGLIYPDEYYDGLPMAIFDVRSDLARRIGEKIGMSADEVRDYYGRIKPAAGRRLRSVS